jgi:ring-1,2-phenylacetyl-CoA epoxidase subunit PaaE
VIPGLGGKSADWNGPTGRLNQSLVLKLLPTLPQWEADRTEYFLCGPQAMMEEIKRALDIMHVPDNRVHRESFVTNPPPPGTARWKPVRPPRPRPRK